MTHTAWYSRCRKAQELWKSTTRQLPDEARRPGLCVIHRDGRRETAGPFPICLPQTHADLNLLSEIRTDAIALFARDGVEWHDFTQRVDGVCWPSTHLLDSQVQCVNFFLSLIRRPGALLDFAREVVPEATSVVRLDNDQFVTFEWIGLRDYLGEARGRKRYRGRYATSIDALLVVEAPKGRTAILVEWKFTESYDKPLNPVSKFGTDRREIYRGLVETDWSPIDRAAPLDAFFHEPYYQLLRLHLLAASMVKDRGNGEFGAEMATVVLVSPTENEDLHARVPTGLRVFGSRMTEVWHRLVPDKIVSFRSIDSRPLLSASESLAERYG